MHGVVLMFHATGSCTVDFRNQQRESGRDQLYETIPFIPDNMTPEMQTEFQRTVHRNHHFDTTVCNHCNTQGQIGRFKLKSCSGCKKVSYCNEECQHADWPAHKPICRSVKSLPVMVDARGVDIPEEDPCPCLSPQEMAYITRFRTDQCAYLHCANPVTVPLPFHCYVTQCTEEKGAWHRMPLAFCSQRCQRKAREIEHEK